MTTGTNASNTIHGIIDDSGDPAMDSLGETTRNPAAGNSPIIKMPAPEPLSYWQARNYLQMLGVWEKLRLSDDASTDLIVELAVWLQARGGCA